MVHEGGFSVTVRDGEFVFRRPDGTVLLPPGRSPPLRV
jgi:hypothetical protein